MTRTIQGRVGYVKLEWNQHDYKRIERKSSLILYMTRNIVNTYRLKIENKKHEVEKRNLYKNKIQFTKPLN
jgi:hypothetical protein